MSKTNLSMRDLFEARRNGATEAKGDAVEEEKRAGEVKQELTKKSKLMKWNGVRDVLMDETMEMLEIPLFDFLAPAWKKYREILEFADAEKYPPNETELVSLSEHTLKVEHHPYLQVTYKGVPLPNDKIEFTLEAELTLQEVVLQIQNGKIMAIRAGAVKGSGELLLDKQSVIKKEFGSYGLPGSIELGDGISLRDIPEVHAAAASGT